MATISGDQHTHFFSTSEERHLRDEDLAAARNVVGILVTIVTVGTLLAVMSVWLAV